MMIKFLLNICLKKKYKQNNYNNNKYSPKFLALYYYKHEILSLFYKQIYYLYQKKNKYLLYDQDKNVFLIQ